MDSNIELQKTLFHPIFFIFSLVQFLWWISFIIFVWNERIQREFSMCSLFFICLQKKHHLLDKIYEKWFHLEFIWYIHALLWQWDKPINLTHSNTTLDLSVWLILHLQSKCQTNISLSNATFLTSLSLTKYQSSTYSKYLLQLLWSSGPPLLWKPWPTRSSNLISRPPPRKVWSLL